MGHPIIATAILNRLLHHRVVITITGDASRFREQQEAGLLQMPESSRAPEPRGGDCASIDRSPLSVVLDTWQEDTTQEEIRAWVRWGGFPLQVDKYLPFWLVKTLSEWGMPYQHDM